MTLTVADILTILKSSGAVGALVIILVGGQKKWWVWGWAYDAMVADLKSQLAKAQAEGEEWKLLAIRSTSQSDQISRVVTARIVNPRRGREKAITR